MATGDSERGGPSQRRAVQLDAVRVMEQSVTDGVCLIGVADDGVPIGDGQLTGDEGRGALDAIFDDLREVPRCRSRRASPRSFPRRPGPRSATAGGSRSSTNVAPRSRRRRRVCRLTSSVAWQDRSSSDTAWATLCARQDTSWPPRPAAGPLISADSAGVAAARAPTRRAPQ